MIDFALFVRDDALCLGIASVASLRQAAVRARQITRFQPHVFAGLAARNKAETKKMLLRWLRDELGIQQGGASCKEKQTVVGREILPSLPAPSA